VRPIGNCPGLYPLETASRNVSLATVGDFLIVASGRYGDAIKEITAVSQMERPSNFRLHYLFVDVNGLRKPYHQATFSFPDRIPPSSLTIEADSAGVWELTFTDTLSVVRYNINGMVFRAKVGVKEAGVMLFQ